MTSGYKIEDKEGLYYLTFQIVGWVGGFYMDAMVSFINVIKFDNRWKTV